MTPEVTEITGLLGGISALTIGAICIGTVITLVITVGITFLAIKMIRKAVGPDRSTLESGIPVLFWDGKRQQLADQGFVGLLINLLILFAWLVLN